LQSAVGQKYQNLEIIVADDGSREDVAPLIAAFADPRIRLRRNPVNLGMGLNNLLAFREARGKYVANLHDDDLWHADFLAKLVPQLEANPHLVLAFCDHYIIRPDGTIDYPATEENTRRWQRAKLTEGSYRPFCKIGLVDQAIPCVMGAVLRKEAIDWQNFPPEVGPAYDLYLTYLACHNGLGAYYLPERLTYYRQHTASTSSLKQLEWIRGQITCYDYFLKDSELNGFHPFFDSKRLELLTALASRLLRQGDKPAARRIALQILKQKFNLKALLVLLASFVFRPYRGSRARH
jgi:glycosyltransferase involved in cell wall biosynthesis